MLQVIRQFKENGYETMLRDIRRKLAFPTEGMARKAEALRSKKYAVNILRLSYASIALVVLILFARAEIEKLQIIPPYSILAECILFAMYFITIIFVAMCLILFFFIIRSFINCFFTNDEDDYVFQVNPKTGKIIDMGVKIPKIAGMIRYYCYQLDINFFEKLEKKEGVIEEELYFINGGGSCCRRKIFIKPKKDFSMEEFFNAIVKSNSDEKNNFYVDNIIYASYEEDILNKGGQLRNLHEDNPLYVGGIEKIICDN